MAPASREWQRPLLLQLEWFISLRWIAALTVVAGAGAEWKLLHWYGRPADMAAIGLAIFAYNGVLWLLVRKAQRVRQTALALLALAWLQLLLDLGCLTLLTLLTGGIDSALRGFFVFHMVFASLLLPRTMAYAGAAVAMAMLSAGLWTADPFPMLQKDRANMLGWITMLLLTVWLTNRITRNLRSQRRRLLRQNRRIRAMSLKLQQQHQGMIQHEKMAAVGQMAAGVAHEIANPLASIDSLLQLAGRKPEKLGPEMVATLREQVNRISQILRQMTAFAHPGDGVWQTSDLNGVVERALAVVQYDPRLNRVQIDRQFSAQMPQVRMVADAMQQVIINLVLNSLDAMDGVAKPTLTIRTEHSDGVCTIGVIDNGHGIAPAHRKRLFEPFFTTKPVGKGTGLGLSISYSLVRNHGGQILVDSRPGEGATFTVRLPIGSTPEHAVAASSTGAR
ncbi:MAG: ATP-binding protein [Planctomycetota bacterium]|nr:ATP-binding protein [Planctomycetota bacterium]